MPVFINDEEREAFLVSNRSPGPMLDWLATAGFRAADAALKLGVFDALADSPLTTADLAECIESSTRGTQILLDGLEVFGYVSQQDGRYANTEMTQRWMLPPEPDEYDYTVVHRFWATILFQLWNNIEETIQQGMPVINFYQWLEDHPATLKDFQTMQSTIAQVPAREVVTLVDLPSTAKRLLDLGGGHGVHTMAFCRAFPGLSGTIFDFPGALENGRRNVAQAGMTEQISFQTGDFMQDDFGKGYDVILLFSIVHGLLPEQNITLLHKVKEALNPGGRVMILEQIAGDIGKKRSPVADTFNRTFKLTLFHLLGAQTYTLDEVQEWLAMTGYTNISHTVLEVNSNSLFIAQK